MILQLLVMIAVILAMDDRRSLGCYNEEIGVRSIKSRLDMEMLVSRADRCRPGLLDHDRDVDVWGTDYLVVCVDNHLRVVSAGRDGLFGTGDDVVSSEERQDDATRWETATWWPRSPRSY